MVFANVGPSDGIVVGYSGGPHVHLELRDGTGRSGLGWRYGEPIDWSGILIDGYMFSSIKHDSTSSSAYNYDGVAYPAFL